MLGINDGRDKNFRELNVNVISHFIVGDQMRNCWIELDKKWTGIHDIEWTWNVILWNVEMDKIKTAYTMQENASNLNKYTNKPT